MTSFSLPTVLVALLCTSAFANPMPPGPPPPMPSIKDTTYSSHILITNGELTTDLKQPLNAHFIDHLSLSNSQQDTNSLTLLGLRSSLIVQNSDIRSSGDGSNDFLAKGAGVLVSEGVLVLDNVKVATQGVISSAIVAAEGATLKAYDSHFSSAGGTLPADYVPVIGPGMKEPPAPLGITGTARTHLTMSNAHSYFYNCDFEALGWGALSTDAAGGDAYLEVNDSRVKVRNSGYGTYADFGARVVINRSELDVATYTGVIAGAADLALNDSHSTSGQNVVMIHSVMGNPLETGKLVISGGQHHSKSTALLVKSANANILLDNTKLTADNHQLIVARINDDPMRTQVGDANAPGSFVTVSNSLLTGDIANRDSERPLALTLLKGTQLRGMLENVHLAISPEASWYATRDSTVYSNSASVADRIQVADGATVTLIVPSLTDTSISQVTPTGGRIHIKANKT